MAYRLGIIGGGNMGSAIVRGGIANGVLAAKEVIIAEVDADRRGALTDTQCIITDDPKHAAAAEAILLAVKPQIFPSVAEIIAPLPARTIVISIMAGLSSRVIRAGLGDQVRVIRAMPNMPCQIGEGMTAIALGQGSSLGDETLAVRLFSAIGKTVMVDESQMYAVTAVSGSGPAYVFLLAEAMQQAAEELGLEASVAKKLVERWATST
jgi:pyrroline-5-carboxylate reductase